MALAINKFDMPLNKETKTDLYEQKSRMYQ